jgi:hypothetical protein
VLMTKIFKSDKIGLPGFVFWNIRFSEFQNKNREGAKCEDFRIPVHLRHEKGIRSIKESRWKKSKSKAEVIKTGLSGLGYRSIRFFLNR